MAQHYYDNRGSSGRLLKKFTRIKQIEDNIERLNLEKRHCDQEHRDEIDKELTTLRDSLKAIKSLVV